MPSLHQHPMCGINRTLMLVGSLLTVIAFSSCVMGWVRANTSPEEAERDGAACRIVAYGKYPERMVHVQSDSRREPSRDEDTNTLLREEDAKYCMRQKGYGFQRVTGSA